MKKPFVGVMSFWYVDRELPMSTHVLGQCKWKIDPYNGPYLANKAPRPSYGGPAPLEDILKDTLPVDWSNADTVAVIGDISHSLVQGDDFILARTHDFKGAQEIAEKIGYRPARAGEFLQLLWLLQQQGNEDLHGWFDCYEGRRQGYVIAANIWSGESTSFALIFDNHIGDSIEEGYVSANSDTYCLFVRNN